MKYLAISEFCITSSGGTPSRSITAYYENGTIPWIKSGELKKRVVKDCEEYITQEAIDKSSAKLVPAGSILLAMYGATVGEVAELGIEAATNQAICHIIPNKEICDKDYLFHFFKSIKNSLIAKSVGGGQPNISQAIVRAIKVPLPPLHEQRRIAAILDKAEALRAKRREAIAKLDQLLQSVFLEMFGDPFLNPKAPVASLNSACSLITDGTHQTPKWVEHGIPFIFQSNVKPGIISLDVKKYISNEEYIKLTTRKPIIKNDILYTIVGSIGNAAMIRTDEKFCFQRHVAHIKTNEKIDPEFLEAQLNHNFIKNQADLRATGIAQRTLILKELKEIKILIPSIKEQKEFILISRKIRECIEISKSAINKIELLISSFQHQYF